MKKLTMLIAVTVVAWSQTVVGQTNELSKNQLGLASDSPTRLTVESQWVSVHDGLQLMLNVEHNLNDTFGLFAYGEAHEHWGQFYAGPTFTPADWIKFGLGVGLEEADKNPLRSGNWLWLGKNKDSLLAVGNYSANGHWWHVHSNHQFNGWLGVGLFARSNAGAGPRLQITVPKKPISFWLSPTYNWDKKGAGFACGLGIRL